MAITYPGAAFIVKTGGVAVVAIYGGVAGGNITNPATAAGQGIFFKQPITVNGPYISRGQFATYAFGKFALNQRKRFRGTYQSTVNVPTTENLYVDLANTASLGITPTTITLTPGQSLAIPNGQAANVTVNAATSGHKFLCTILQPATQFPPTPIASSFPPNGPTSLTKTIPSYLYQQYSDDDTLQMFVNSYNTMTQTYVNTFNDLNLPIYTGSMVSGTLLDWVGNGVYGMTRPPLYSGKSLKRGPFGTYAFNGYAFGKMRTVSIGNIVATTDDIFRRILTWHIYKGDGKAFTVRWLKRRIQRFLNGTNGTDCDTSTTYQTSITFGVGNEVSIRLERDNRMSIGGAVFNKSKFNSAPFGFMKSSIVYLPPIANAAILQEAINSGALELPFQFTYVVTLL